MRFLILIVFLLIIVVFALSNPAPVHLGIWPTDYAVDVPMSLGILIGMGFAFLIGALFVWFSAFAQMRRARRAEAKVRALENEVAALRVRLTQLATLPPGTAVALPPPV